MSDKSSSAYEKRVRCVGIHSHTRIRMHSVRNTTHRHASVTVLCPRAYSSFPPTLSQQMREPEASLRSRAPSCEPCEPRQLHCPCCGVSCPSVRIALVGSVSPACVAPPHSLQRDGCSLTIPSQNDRPDDLPRAVPSERRLYREGCRVESQGAALC
jgi:hypothetical protein